MRNKIDCQVISSSHDGAAAELLFSSDEIQLTLAVGLQGVVGTEEAALGNMLLVSGALPMTDNKWKEAVLHLPLGLVLPHLSRQE